VFEEMLVKDVMRKNVVVAKPELTIREASQVMADMHIGSLVVRDGDKVVGIVTERNVLLSVAKGLDTDGTTVDCIMSKKVVTIGPDKKLSEAVSVMVEHKIKKLPVMDGAKLVGMITASDIAVVEPKLIASIADLISLKMPGYRGG
jgi:CBS-domain-containing membrane protein